MQGQLRGEKLTALVETECGHCHRPLAITVDSDLNCEVQTEEAEPLVYAPLMDVQKLEPSIIDGF